MRENELFIVIRQWNRNDKPPYTSDLHIYIVKRYFHRIGSNVKTIPLKLYKLSLSDARV
jgi:hypothetical protein